MMTYYSELRYKEVIDVHSGFRLGCVCDVEFDDKEGKIVSLITPGKLRFFGLLGKEDDYVLPWDCIVKIGKDIILVEHKGVEPLASTMPLWRATNCANAP